MLRRFRKDTAVLPAVVEFLDAALVEQHAGPRAAYIVHLAVEELFTNLAKYSKGGTPDVAIDVSSAGRKMTVTLTEEGSEPFDITAVPPADVSLALEDRPIGGLGIHLVKTLVDSLQYRSDGERNTITVVKNLE